MPISDFHPIETPRLILRLLAPDDAPTIVAYRQLPEVMRYLGNRPTTLEVTLDEIEYNREAPIGTPGYCVRFVIVAKESNTVVGDCLLKVLEDEPYHATLGYAMNPAYQGKGYATEAVRATLGFAFERLKLHRITATIFAEHTASVKVAERVGMRREALFRKAVWREERWLDDAVYAILEEEWKPGGLQAGRR